MRKPRKGAAMASGRAVVSQCATALASTTSSSGTGPSAIDLERAVLIIGLEDAIGRQQHRQQERDPQGARRDAREERDDRDRGRAGISTMTARKKPRRGAGAAALAQREHEVARNHCVKAVIAPRPRARSASEAQLEPARPSSTWVAAMMMPPVARWCRHQGGETVARCDIEADRRLVEQPERARNHGEARKGQAATLSSGQDRGLKIGEMRRVRKQPAPRRYRRRPGSRARSADFPRTVRCELDRIAMGDEMALLADGQLIVAAGEDDGRRDPAGPSRR